MGSCGDCTACCHSLCIDVEDGVDYKWGGSCEHVCEAGCSVYDSRPKVCVSFKCAYLEYDLPSKYIPEEYGFFVETLKMSDDTTSCCVQIHPIYHGQRNVQPDQWIIDNRENILEILEEIELHSEVFIRYTEVKTINGCVDFDRFIITSTL
jgi:hypothetical protein